MKVPFALLVATLPSQAVAYLTFLPHSHLLHGTKDGLTKRASLHYQSTSSAESPSAKIDMDRVQTCADHFGKCSVEELEELRAALHEERVTYFTDETSGVKPELDAEEEMKHMMFENDLSMQLSLMKEEMTKVEDADSSAIMGMPLPMDGAVALDHKWNEPHMPLSPDGTAMAMVGNGMSDAMVICAAILLVMVAPHILHG